MNIIVQYMDKIFVFAINKCVYIMLVCFAVFSFLSVCKAGVDYRLEELTLSEKYVPCILILPHLLCQCAYGNNQLSP